LTTQLVFLATSYFLKPGWYISWKSRLELAGFLYPSIYPRLSPSERGKRAAATMPTGLQKAVSSCRIAQHLAFHYYKLQPLLVVGDVGRWPRRGERKA
jgi:hypothetical protein